MDLNYPLKHAAAALTLLADHLPNDGSFKAAKELVLSMKGRVIVTGVGKSGHIGGKIAATLASTGTPAFFVHPTEALHGDLGMITPDDVVLAISHSGESKELAAVIAYCMRFDIPIIALTGKPESTLGRAAKAHLFTRVTEEACPLNLAPTTSTTVALALADTLAVALMQERGFAKENFAVFHPGGKLGAQLLTVRDIMLKDNIPLLSPSAPMADVLIALTQANLGCVGFIDNAGALVGIFTDGDLKRRLSPDLMQHTGADVMTASPRTIAADAFATQGVSQMQQDHVKGLWVVEEGRPIGLFRLDECLAKGVI